MCQPAAGTRVARGSETRRRRRHVTHGSRTRCVARPACRAARDATACGAAPVRRMRGTGMVRAAPRSVCFRCRGTNGFEQGNDMDVTGRQTTLTISSRNYSSWSMRGWLLAKLSGLVFETVSVPIDAASRAELLLLSPSILVPCLTHDGNTVWDTLAIAEYLNEIRPQARLLPEDRRPRALPVDLRRDAFRFQRVALRVADEPARAFPRLPHLVACAARHRADRDDLARVWPRTAAPGCSARRSASPTRCMRRSSRAS